MKNIVEENNFNLKNQSIMWLGGYPSHYVRMMHLEVEKKRPNQIHFFYIDDSKSQSDRNYENGKFPDKKFILKNNISIIKFIKIINFVNPKLIIICGYNNKLLMTALLLSCFKKIPFCFWCDSNIINIFDKSIFISIIKRLGLNFILSRAHKLLYIGTRTRDFYLWILGTSKAISKLYFLPYPAIVYGDQNILHKGDLNKKFTIMYLGRIVKQKGLINLINSLCLLPKLILDNIHLNVYGDGIEFKLINALVNQKNLQNSVTFHGPIESDLVQNCYDNSDLLMLPSNYEPWGLVVNEALLARVPVMCPFWVGSAIDLIVDGESGYLLNDNLPSTIASGIEKAYHNRANNLKMGINGKNRVLEGGWNIDAACTRLINLIDESD